MENDSEVAHKLKNVVVHSPAVKNINMNLKQEDTKELFQISYKDGLNVKTDTVSSVAVKANSLQWLHLESKNEDTLEVKGENIMNNRSVSDVTIGASESPVIITQSNNYNKIEFNHTATVMAIQNTEAAKKVEIETGTLSP